MRQISYTGKLSFEISKNNGNKLVFIKDVKGEADHTKIYITPGDTLEVDGKMMYVDFKVFKDGILDSFPQLRLAVMSQKQANVYQWEM